jgi:hypothetical protein
VPRQAPRNPGRRTDLGHHVLDKPWFERPHVLIPVRVQRRQLGIMRRLLVVELVWIFELIRVGIVNLIKIVELV